MLNLKKMMGIAALAVAMLCLCSSSLAQMVAVVHVDIKNGALNPPNFGMNGWGSNAHRFLQDAIQSSKDLLEDENLEFEEVHIWIAAAFDGNGDPIEYRPDQNKDNEDPNHPDPNKQCDPEADSNCCPPYGNCNKNHSFDFRGFPGDVRLMGGFPPDPHTVGQNGATLEHRDPWIHRTYLSGDLHQNSEFSVSYDEDGVLQLNYINYSIPVSPVGNSVTIIETNSDDLMLMIDGLIIRRALGLAVTDWHPGLYTHKTIIQNCIIEENKGGGIQLSGNAEVRGAIVQHNGSLSSGSTGGCKLQSAGSQVDMVDSEVMRNIGGSGGGGIHYVGGVDGTLTLVNVKLLENVGRLYGGAMHAGSGGHVHLWNCLIAGNRAVMSGFHGRGGGGIEVVKGGISVINSTVVDNYAEQEDGGGGILVGNFGHATIRNSIIWGNTSGSENEPDGIQLIQIGSSFTIEYSNLQECDNYPNECADSEFSNVDVDPEFVGPAFPNPYALADISPCIDAGNNCLIPCYDHALLQLVDDPEEFPGWEPSGSECATEPGAECERLPIDIAGRARVMLGALDDVVDMGAFEFHPCPECKEDLNGDGTVGVPDLIALLSAWGRAFRGGPDFNQDGNVGVPDLIILLGAWGNCPPCEESLGFGGGGMESQSSGGASPSIESCIDTFAIDEDVDALIECIDNASSGGSEW